MKVEQWRPFFQWREDTTKTWQSFFSFHFLIKNYLAKQLVFSSGAESRRTSYQAIKPLLGTKGPLVPYGPSETESGNDLWFKNFVDLFNVLLFFDIENLTEGLTWLVDRKCVEPMKTISVLTHLTVFIQNWLYFCYFQNPIWEHCYCKHSLPVIFERLLY